MERTAVLDGTYDLGRDGRSLVVAVAIGGGCQERGSASVRAVESETDVLLTASVARTKPPVSPSPGVTCTADLIAQNVTVALTKPLGGRRVVDAFSQKELRGR